MLKSTLRFSFAVLNLHAEIPCPEFLSSPYFLTLKNLVVTISVMQLLLARNAFAKKIYCPLTLKSGVSWVY